MELPGNLLGPPTEAVFADMLIKAMRTAGDQREFHYDKDNFQIQFFRDGTYAGVARLHNVYREYCDLPPAKREKRFRVIVRGFLVPYKTIPDNFEDARPDLLPLIKPKTELELNRLQGETTNLNASPIPHQEIGDHLIACVGYDLRETVATISDHQLETWNVSFYEAMEAAIQNLAEIDFPLAKFGSGFYGSTTNSVYNASRILQLNLIDSLEVNGSPVAMIPHRHMLMVTGSDDLEGLGRMAEAAEKTLDEPRPLSNIAVRLDDGQWETWLPERDHPHYRKFRLLELDAMNSE